MTGYSFTPYSSWFDVFSPEAELQTTRLFFRLIGPSVKMRNTLPMHTIPLIYRAVEIKRLLDNARWNFLKKAALHLLYTSRYRINWSGWFLKIDREVNDWVVNKRERSKRENKELTGCDLVDAARFACLFYSSPPRFRSLQDWERKVGRWWKKSLEVRGIPS